MANRPWKGINDEGISGAAATPTGTWTTVDSDLTLVCTINVRDGASKLYATIYNSDVTLAGFALQFRIHPLSAFYSDLANEPSDFTSAIMWPILGVSGDLTTESSDTSEHLALDIQGLDAVRFYAAARTGEESKIKIYWQQR